jgi:hypothetical protein
VDNTDLNKLEYVVKKSFFLRRDKDEQLYFTESPRGNRDHNEGGYKVGARYLDYSCEEFTIAECTKDLFKQGFIERV